MSPSKKWSQKVTRDSHAMDLEPGVFKMTPKRLAKSMKRSVEESTNLKSSPYRSGMSMLNFYVNRAGSRLPDERREAIQSAKHEFRKLYKMADLGTVNEWLEKVSIPKGSPYTKRFGQKYTNKMTSPVGKVPNRSFRGKYTKLALDNPLGGFTSEALADLLARKDATLAELNDDLTFVTNLHKARGADSPWEGRIDRLGEEINKHLGDRATLHNEYSSRLPASVNPPSFTGGPTPAGAAAGSAASYLPSLKSFSLGAGAPGLLGAAAGAYEAQPGEGLYGAARGGASAGVGGGIGTLIGHGLGTLAGHPTAGTIAGSAIGGLGGYMLGRPDPVEPRKLAGLGSIRRWIQKRAALDNTDKGIILARVAPLIPGLLSAAYSYNTAPAGHEYNHAVNSGAGAFSLGTLGLLGSAFATHKPDWQDTFGRKAAIIGATALGALGGHYLGRPTELDDRGMEAAGLVSPSHPRYKELVTNREKQAVGTGDNDYESPSGSYGQHKHVQGENECHLCKGQPIIEVGRDEREAEKQAEGHAGVEYHEILKIVAEAHGIDLTKPESIDLLPALLREADHVMMKHEKLETAEEQMGEQMMGQNEQSQ